MPVIGVTGGIASGKSTVTRMIIEGLRNLQAGEVEFFSADDFSHELLEQNPVVRDEIFLAFGSEVFGSDNHVNRAFLRELVFQSEVDRVRLENILHPRIRQEWVSRSGSFRIPGKYFVAEIPLLYETESAHYFDSIVVVEADAQVQLERLSSKRGWSLESALRVIAAQMPANEKIQRADILILNHHTEKLLHDQIALMVKALLTHYA